MAESSSSNVPEIRFRSPTYGHAQRPKVAQIVSSEDLSAAERQDIEHEAAKHRDQSPRPSITRSKPSRPNSIYEIYQGSYANTRPNSVSAETARRPSSSRTPPATPRDSVAQIHLESLLPQDQVELNTFGLEELRDGFFDAPFYHPISRKKANLHHHAVKTLPRSFQKHHPLSIRSFVPQQVREARGFFHHLASRAGIKLLKSFLGVFLAYIICLIPASRDWLGRYNYIIVLSALVNHPGRPVGSQIDGAFLTVIGTAAGLAWGSLALYASTSTNSARAGYGGVLATFLILFAATIAYLRCVFLRCYQAVISAGVAICYTTLANTSETVGWHKVFDYGIPWALGQLLCLVVACTVFPTAGARALANVLHESFCCMYEGLCFPRSSDAPVKENLPLQFVRLSTAVRDFTIEITFSRFASEDIRQLRNLVQGTIRSILSIYPETTLFEDRLDLGSEAQPNDVALLIRRRLAEPTHKLVHSMKLCCAAADRTVREMAGTLSHVEPSEDRPSLRDAVLQLKAAKRTFDTADALLLQEEDVTTAYKDNTTAIELFLFVHPVRQTANHVDSFASHVLAMEERSRSWRLQLPSYPWHKAINRTNAQVRHDRGGLTAGFFFRLKSELDRTLSELLGTTYVPLARENPEVAMAMEKPGLEMKDPKRDDIPGSEKARYKFWKFLHNSQGFESRFALKVVLVTTLLSIPAWLPESRDWWNKYESWWAVVAVWLMMHPRVGGTFQDLLVRCLCAVIGATWGGLANRAGQQNPYVLAVFAAVYLAPMLYRFTQSTHPRSGLTGCISFVIISLDIYSAGPDPATFTRAWTLGAAFVVGITAAVVVNWLLWPFVARHELRKSIAGLLLLLGILYRGIIARYMYFAPGEEPQTEDIQRSEILEGRVREGFVRLRQLLELTRHEVRLRAPFDPLPYSALIAAGEAFFEHLVRVRQSSLYFQSSTPGPDPETVDLLFAPRRDAVAVIIMNLYAFACALRQARPVPRYLPNAAIARKKLLDRMAVVEAEQFARFRAEELAKRQSGEQELTGKKRRWTDVYHYAYLSALTGIVEELQQLQLYSKQICGEVDWS